MTVLPQAHPHANSAEADFSDPNESPCSFSLADPACRSASKEGRSKACATRVSGWKVMVSVGAGTVTATGDPNGCRAQHASARGAGSDAGWSEGVSE